MENKKDLGMPIAIVVSGLLIALSIYATGGIKIVNGPDNGGEANLGDAVRPEIVISPVDDTDYIVGKRDAEITIVTYTDLECPFCKRFHETMGKIMDEYRSGGKVAWVYRQMPLDTLHSKARKEAEATECAGLVGGNVKFWEYVNKVFAYTNSNDSLDMSLLPKIASEIGINVDAFNSCLENGKTKAFVESDENDGFAAGAQGTPYSVILTKNGEKFPIDGAMPYESVKAAIESLI